MKILILMILLLPIVYAAPYGSNKYNCGLFNIGCEDEVVEEEASEGGAEAGASVFASQTATMTEQLCDLSKGMVWYNETCWNCDGMITERDNKILCVKCPDGFILQDGECKIKPSDIPTPFYFTIGISMIFITALYADYRRRKKNDKRNKPNTPTSTIRSKA